MVEGEKGSSEEEKKLDIKIFYSSGVSYITSKQIVRPSWHHEEKTYKVRKECGAWGIAVIDNLPFFYVAYNVGGLHEDWSVYRPIRPSNKFSPPFNSGEVNVEGRQKILKVLGVKTGTDPKSVFIKFSDSFTPQLIAKYNEFFERYDRDPELRAKFGHEVRETLNYKHIDPR